jgi:hypothetical protein
MSNISFSSGYGEFASGEFFSSASFELKSNDFQIFSREFSSDSISFINLAEDYLIFTAHNFVTGEELIYDYEIEESNLPLRISSTVISGISTNILPKTVYAVRLDSSKIQLAATKEKALLKQPEILNLTNYGKGIHKISSKNPNKNTLITINNVIQDPIISTAVTTHITDSITDSDLSVIVNDSSFLKGGDLVKIDEEIFKILSIGIGTDNNIFFDRGLLGSFSNGHNEGSVITKLKGNYNIVENFIYFTQSPYGNIFDSESGLTNGSSFSGRVFLRSGLIDTEIGPYDNNFIFDDISGEFDGRKTDFTLTVDNENKTGFSTDNAIITLNDVFQPPSRLTGNIINGAYVLSESSGISSITFTGNLDYPEYDVNISELPRGGILFSVGSTGGFGYQPVISAGATAIVSTAGTIQSVSIGYSGSGYRAGIQTVNVGVAISNVENYTIEIIGNAVVSNGNIEDIIITNPGSGYTNTNPPDVIFDPPLSYTKIPLVYSDESSGFGAGATIDIVVGQGSSVIDFNLSNLGFAYQKGEILTVEVGGQSGIPTDSSLEFKEFKILVDEVYNDDSSIRTIGRLIVFDPVDSLFNGQRKSFPLRLNGEQTAILSKIGSDVKVENSILVFIDSVLQVPGEAYTFNGGSILTLSQPPRAGSKSTILFYAGTESVDIRNATVLQTIKRGDTVRIFDNFDRFIDQNQRTVTDITSVDVIRTNLYSKQGISINDEIRPLKWCPQNVDKFISGSGSTISSVISKDRIIYEPLIYPTAYVIKNIVATNTEIFVDNVKTFFDNINESPVTNDINIISNEIQVQAAVTATVSIAGTIESLTIENAGVGYNTSPQISVASPVGVGTTARITATIDSNGSINSLIIVNAGTGYTFTSPPLILVESPRQRIETIEQVDYQGDFGIISGIGTTTISGSSALIFDLFIPTNSFIRNSSVNNVGSALTGISGISTGYYFHISNSNIGNSVTSLDNSNSVIGVGITFIDNVYEVFSFAVKQKVVSGVGVTFINEVIVKVSDNSSLVGVGGSGYYGDYSWGRIYNGSPAVINNFKAYSPGITTSTIIQRNNPLKFINYLS